MDFSREFIILNGQAKTLQIDSIERIGSNAFRVRFKNNPKAYTYGEDKVVWLNNPKLVDVANSKGFKGSYTECLNYIKQYNGTNESYFQDYKGGNVSIVRNETGDALYTENIPYGITTLEEMAEYINSCDDFPLAAYDIIAINGWTDDTAEIFGVCSFGNHRVVLKEGVAEVVEL